MKCTINFQSPPQILPHLNYTNQIRSSIWIFNKPTTPIQPNEYKFSTVKTRATTVSVSSSSILLAAANLPPGQGNISVLIQTSVLLLFAFWITNFVVPEIILKDLQSDKTNENGEFPAEDEQPRGKK